MKKSSKPEKSASKNERPEKSTKSTKSAKSKKSRHESDDDEFISDDVLSGGGNSHFKPSDGSNKVRIISKPVFGWLAWEDGEEEGDNRKPIRTPLDEQPDMDDFDDDNKPKKFMAVAIIDHEDDEVKIWEVTQQSIIKSIKALAANEDWGPPFSYDINIDKKGEKLKTKYTVTPSPKKPLSKDLIRAAEDKPCNLQALFEGENPWETDADDATEYFFK